MKAWFTRIRQAVSGRLMTLKHKFGKAQFQRYRALFHARRLEARDWMKESWLIVKCAVLIALCKLQMALTPEALRSYRQWLKNLPSRFTKENFQKWGAAFLAWLKSLPPKLRSMRKSGLLASLTLFALLLFLGHASSVAWLTYTTPATVNSFQVGRMDLVVNYKNDTMSEFAVMTSDTPIFKNEALYEPGYTQLVYLKVTNKGSIPIQYKLTTGSYHSEPSTNVYGEKFKLDNYLCYGVAFDQDLDQLAAKVSPRSAAKQIAATPVAGNLEQLSALSTSHLAPEATEYAAIIIRMPESVGNEANHDKNAPPPKITLGVTVYAQQADAPLS